MVGEVDYDGLAQEILRRHDNAEAEANITSAVRDFLIGAGLARADQIVEENPPAQASRRAVDLTALDTFVEVKRRIGTAAGFSPEARYVEQLDDYLDQSERAGQRSRMGILTDGKYWLLRWPDAGAVKTAVPYGFTLDAKDGGGWRLRDWLRDYALFARQDVTLLDRESVEEHFSPRSLHYEKDIARLRALYDRHKQSETVRVKRRLWDNLLRAALGEVAGTRRGLDDLFVRHTYLTAVIGLAVQATFGIEIAGVAEHDAEGLLKGEQLRNATGLHGIVESDFFAWPTEVADGLPLVKALARRIARFAWAKAPADIGAMLYETVIPPDERRQLGEYYTPAWLARVMVRELIEQPLEQRVLDPACGSGTFVVEAVGHFLAAAERDELNPGATLDRLLDAVTGVDVHPVAVHLARAAWVLAARPAIQAASDAGYNEPIAVPVYLGDALQLRYYGDLFAQRDVPVYVDDERNTVLRFPRRLVQEANAFDALMSDVAGAIERGSDPTLALDDHNISDAEERDTLHGTIAEMQRLHAEGSDHIWAYYSRNLVRPVALEHRKVDVVIGNPPWLSYRNTANTLRTALEERSKNYYGIWAGGRYANRQDVAGLFFTRSADLYLKDGGVIGMVLPHSALQTGQYAKWRSGAWHTAGSESTLTVDFGYKPAWDLERLEPNTFFPVPASVVFARRTGGEGKIVSLAGQVERWLGKTDTANIRRVRVAITDTSESGESPYADYSRQGATIVPRCLFFVEETANPAIVQAGQTITVNPRRGGQDKRPWRDLDLTAITEQTIEQRHVYDVYLGETLVPYTTLNPLQAVLPLRSLDASLPEDKDGVGGIRLGGLDRRMRERWKTISDLWEEHKAPANKLSLLGRLDFHRELSSQLTWRQDTDGRPVRIVYTQGGQPTAAMLHDDKGIVDTRLYWITCKDIQEAHYLLAAINSDALYQAVTQFMSKGQFGARDLHKQLWKLSIPEYDGTEALHGEIAAAGEAAATGAARELAGLRERRDRVTVTIARRELRKWLRESAEGARVERAVGRLLG